MNIQDCQTNCQKFVKNFPGKVSISLFGSTAREGKGNDIDLLFEIPPEVFHQYFIDCYSSGINFVDGSPNDPMNLYWEYYSPAEVRFRIISDILNIDESLTEKIRVAFQGNRLDIMVLPFDWKENEEILEIINRKDPLFSKNLERDTILLFEKKN